MMRIILTTTCGVGFAAYLYRMFELWGRYKEFEDDVGESIFGNAISEFAKKFVEIQLESLAVHAFVFFTLTCILVMMKPKKEPRS
jgi:hypothetical protein